MQHYFKNSLAARYLASVCLLALVSLLPVSQAAATHIMGANLTYTATGPGVYTLKLVLYFDQVNGQPSAIDQEVQITAFNVATQQSVGVFTLPQAGYTISNCYPDCGYCVRLYSYEKTNVALSVPPAGIKLVYERCCRSSIVQNVYMPDITGMYISTTIPVSGNTSAVFNALTPPPLFQHTAYTFNAAATDADGDELHYRLDNLYRGAASTSNPNPSPPNYSQTITQWASGFSTSNMLGGPQPLQIDYNTGIITATPGNTGYFQIAYYVEEHRSGQIIATTRNEILVFVASPACAPLGTSAELASASWTAYPNPFGKQVDIVFPEGVAGMVTAELVNSEGRIVAAARPLSVYGSRAVFSLQGRELPAGLYLLRVRADEKYRTFRLLHQPE